MKLKFILTAFVFSQYVAAQPIELPSGETSVKLDERVLRTNKALKSFKGPYVNASTNKAFAQSPGGHWNWRSDRVTADLAIEDALAACNKHVKKNEPACVIVNVNGEWVSPQQ